MALDKSSLVMRGTVAELRCGYQRAAKLGAWTLTTASDGEGFHLSAKVLSRDEYWMGQGPDLLVLSGGSGEWRFREISVHGADPIEVIGTSAPEVR